MSISRNSVRPYLAKSEVTLADESFPPALNQLTEAGLRSRIDRARRLRDKYRDLAERQTRQIKGKAEPTRKRTPTGNKGTLVKQQFFAETVTRFEKRLANLESASAKAAAKTAMKAGLVESLERKHAASSAGVKATRKASKGMKAIPSEKVKQFPNLQTMKGAARANFSRAQAKRDSR